MEWISVKDRLPEFKNFHYTKSSKHVLVCRNGGYVTIGVFSENPHGKTEKSRMPRWEVYGRIENGITHWMPLPEPPKDA